jgi:hypothetical protein
MDTFESFDEGDIVRSYVDSGVLRMYKIVKWRTNDFIFLVDVRNLDRVDIDDLDKIAVVIDVDMLHENYTKKGVPEQAKILYGEKNG